MLIPEREAESSVKLPVCLGRAVPISWLPEQAEPHCKQSQLCYLSKMSLCWKVSLSNPGAIKGWDQICDLGVTFFLRTELRSLIPWPGRAPALGTCRRVDMQMCTHAHAYTESSALVCIWDGSYFLREPSLEQNFQNDQYKFRHTCDYVFRILKDHNITI